ncbi:chromate efflux transporter [Brevundimonas variabilis]|nr:chromate efflux transporter [Brevundimonas variabilis]
MSLPALFGRFLMFGCLAFGGPVAQIAMIRRDLIERDRWMSPGHFNRLLAVMQVLPGPEAHELCVHLGIRARGRLGGLLAGIGFMLPGLVLMMAAAWAYVTFGPGQAGLAATFLGIQVAVLAVIVRAVHRIGQHILEDRLLWSLAIIAGAATLLGVSFWIVLAGTGLVYGLGHAGRTRLAIAAGLFAATAGAVGLMLAAESGVGWPSLSRPDLGVASTGATQAGAAGILALFLAGLKAGLLTFGGAYTAIPFVRADTVGRGWVSEGQFLDGVALSGVLPAPLVIFCTFVGYVAGGPLGALAITAGVFLPAFAFLMIFYERLERVMDMAGLQTLLAGVAAGVVGIIAATTLQLAWATVPRLPTLWPALPIFAAALAIVYLWKSRFNAVVIVALAGLAGALAFG